MEQKKSAAKLVRPRSSVWGAPDTRACCLQAQATAPPPTRHQQEIATGVLNMVQLQEFVLHVQGKLLVPVNAAELKRSVRPSPVSCAWLTCGRLQAKVLRPVNFEDVVAERANEKLCGFPCCAEKLSSQVRDLVIFRCCADSCSADRKPPSTASRCLSARCLTRARVSSTAATSA